MRTAFEFALGLILAALIGWFGGLLGGALIP